MRTPNQLNSNTIDGENLLDDDDDNYSEQEEVINDFSQFEWSEDDLEQEEEVNDFSQFEWPEEDDDDEIYFSNNFNDDLFVNNHLNSKQFNSLNYLEEINYKRSKGSNKKMHAQRQIKTKYAQSIKIQSHNKHLYMHHRLFKQVQLDPPKRNYISSSSSYSPETWQTINYEQKPSPKPIKPVNKIQPIPRSEPVIQFREYTINETNIPNEPCFDDAMITFLLEMQNRDLSPEDYEMLLRLDDRIQRKTIDTNILDRFPTIQANETHLNEQCTICMENYISGQQLKLLPCTHMFHSDCIQTYLKEFSTQCPLDNLPLI